MDQAKLMQLGIATGLLYAAYRFGPAPLKAMALGAAGVLIAKNLPIPGLSAALA